MFGWHSALRFGFVSAIPWYWASYLWSKGSGARTMHLDSKLHCFHYQRVPIRYFGWGEEEPPVCHHKRVPSSLQPLSSVYPSAIVCASKSQPPSQSTLSRASFGRFSRQSWGSLFLFFFAPLSFWRDAGTFSATKTTRESTSVSIEPTSSSYCR